MRRKLRRSYDEPGHAHELTFGTWHKRPYFLEPQVCEKFLEYLHAARKRRQFQIWAYVVMSDHVHLLIWPGPGGATVAEILSSIKQPFSRCMRKTGLCTAPVFWQAGGGYDRNIFSAQATQASIDYIHNNPVARDLCKRPEEYRWSSAAWYMGCRDTPIAIDPMPLRWLDDIRTT